MRILLISIPNHHFFQWANQLKDSGYEVYWFDITDGAGFSEKIKWVRQFNGWKLKWNYPFRHRIKKNFPQLYSLLEKVTVNKTKVVFESILNDIQPDVVHCFEMVLGGLPILSVMENNKIPLIYSSWGSDLFDFQNLGVSNIEAKLFLERVDYLITDCHRDFYIAKELGFRNKFLGVFPGNGGIEIEKSYIQPTESRKTICVKGYDDGVGMAIQVLKAIENLEEENPFKFLIYSADDIVVEYLKESSYFKNKEVEIISRNTFLANKLLLRKMGECVLYIGNSTSDGMPNSLLEAMGMGVFPIQSNPGKVSEEVVKSGVNGFLINDPKDYLSISFLINEAVKNVNLRINAQVYNVNFIEEKYNRAFLRKDIVDLYQQINFE